MLPLAALLVALSPLPASAQRTLDLAGPLVGRRPVAAGASFTLRLINLVPRVRDRYVVEIRNEPQEVPPLSLDTTRGVLKFNDPCEQATGELEAALQEASTEAQVETVIRETRTGDDWGECSATLGRIIMERTTYDVEGVYQVRAGEQLVVEVTRPGDDGPAEWRFVFASEPRGEWRLGYGFTFLPRVYPQYYTEQSDTNPSQFIIRKESGSKRRDLTTNYDFIPSLLFTWLPSAGRYRDWNWGLTGGLGYDLTQTALFAGIAGTYNENITLTAGLAIHEQPRLAPQFTPGEVLKEDLDAAALHEDRYGPNVFFGLSFRLDRTPFSRPEREEQGGGGGNAEETRPDPGNEAPEATNPNPEPGPGPGGPAEGAFDNSITVGTKIGAFEVEGVEAGGDTASIVFKLAEGRSALEVTGEYEKVGDTHCVADVQSDPVLPHVKDHPAARLCLMVPDALAPRLANVEENAPVEVKIDRFRVRWNVETETAEYVEARVTEIVEPAAAGGS
ncbi:MAG TPA: hypothetical protein VHG91_03640 [Longimicrobium sp.]|nr:hypothetical protein [Longimicrobium sp.]